MSITARHKRPGGFKKLVQSLETTPRDRRKKILEALAAEDADLAHHAEMSLFSFEDFLYLDDPTICEITAAMAPEMRTLAMALAGADPAIVKRFLDNMLNPHKIEYNTYATGQGEITGRESSSAQYRVIAKARELENQRRIKLKPYSGDYPDEL